MITWIPRQALASPVLELVSMSREALRELLPALEELSGLLKAIEPMMREEAVITQMEAHRSDREWLERLRDALEHSLRGLQGMSAEGGLLPGMRNCLLGIFSLLDGMVRHLVSAVENRGKLGRISIADWFDRMQDLMRG